MSYFDDIFNFDDDEERGGKEPSFSLHEFKKWLSKQKDKPKDSYKEEMREKFKKRVKDKIRKKREEKKD
jgi:hypothetical protein